MHSDLWNPSKRVVHCNGFGLIPVPIWLPYWVHMSQSIAILHFIFWKLLPSLFRVVVQMLLLVDLCLFAVAVSYTHVAATWPAVSAAPSGTVNRLRCWQTTGRIQTRCPPYAAYNLTPVTQSIIWIKQDLKSWIQVQRCFHYGATSQTLAQNEDNAGSICHLSFFLHQGRIRGYVWGVWFFSENKRLFVKLQE